MDLKTSLFTANRAGRAVGAAYSCGGLIARALPQTRGDPDGCRLRSPAQRIRDRRLSRRNWCARHEGDSACGWPRRWRLGLRLRARGLHCRWSARRRGAPERSRRSRARVALSWRSSTLAQRPSGTT